MARDRNYIYHRIKYTSACEDERLMVDIYIESSSTCSERQLYWRFQGHVAFKTNSTAERMRDQ